MILVCYLVGPGAQFADKALAFIDSYLLHPAGVEHEVLLVHKEGASPLLHPPGWAVVVHPNEGLDIGSLQRVAADHAGADQIMWLGSHARILADGWLEKFHDAGQRDAVGAVAATASFEAGVSYEHPNPHLRTSALMISPSLLNSLGFAAVADRGACYEFEHGRQSLYRRLRERGLDGVVVGRSGRVYREDEWATSQTFRHGNQSELLIADNHTDSFAAASADERLALGHMSGWHP